MSLDELQEKLAEFDDYIQSSDIAAMQSKSLTSTIHTQGLHLTFVAEL